MPTKLSTTIKKIEIVPNPDNARLIFEFHKFMKSNGSSERHQNNNLQTIISCANYLTSWEHSQQTRLFEILIDKPFWFCRSSSDHHGVKNCEIVHTESY